MILLTHAIVGGAVAGALGQGPLVSFAVGLASHYLLDMVPHWEYKLRSAEVDIDNPLKNRMSGGRDFYLDLIKLALDAVLGIILALLFFANPVKEGETVAILAGVFGGFLPDFCQFLYMKIRREPFRSLQIFHHRFHSADRRLKESGVFLGFSFQLAIILIVFFLGNWRVFF